MDENSTNQGNTKPKVLPKQHSCKGQEAYLFNLEHSISFSILYLLRQTSN